VRTAALVKKECLHFWRDPALMLLVLWMFLVDVFVCAYGFSLDITGFPIAVNDLDGSQASRTVLDHLGPPRFRIMRYTNDDAAI
jgi:ABC-2 type transport system permease protein